MSEEGPVEVVTTSEAEVDGDAGGVQAPSTGAPEAGTGGASSWELLRAGLPPELRNEGSMTSSTSFEEYAKHNVNRESLIGRKGVLEPKWDDPEDVARYSRDIGVPETPEGYDLEGFAPPEGLPWDDTLQSRMLAKMHSLSLRPDQVKDLMQEYANLQGEEWSQAQSTVAQDFSSGVSALRTEWGAAYEQNVDGALRAFKAFAGDDWEHISNIKTVAGTEIGNDPVVIRRFHELYKSGMQEDSGTLGSQPKSYTNTPGEAGSKITDLQLDPEFMKAYTTRDHPGHAAAVQRMRSLHVDRDGTEVSPTAPHFD